MLVDSSGQLKSPPDLVQWPPLPFAGWSSPYVQHVHRTNQRFFAFTPRHVEWPADPLLQARAVIYGNGVYVIAGALSIQRSTDTQT